MKFDLLANLNVDRLSACANESCQAALTTRHSAQLNLLHQCAYVLKCIARAKNHTKTKKQLRVGIIGAGLFAQELVSKLLRNSAIKAPSNICVCCRSAAKSRPFIPETVELTTQPSYLLTTFGARLVFLCSPAESVAEIAKAIDPKPSVIFCSVVSELSRPKLVSLLRAKQVVCLRAMATNPAIQFHKTLCGVDQEPSAEQLSEALVVQCIALGLPVEQAEPLCASIMSKHRQETLLA